MVSKHTVELSPEDLDFVISLLIAHCEGLTSWWDDEKGWRNPEFADEYDQTDRIRQTLSRSFAS